MKNKLNFLSLPIILSYLKSTFERYILSFVTRKYKLYLRFRKQMKKICFYEYYWINITHYTKNSWIFRTFGGSSLRILHWNTICQHHMAIRTTLTRSLFKNSTLSTKNTCFQLFIEMKNLHKFNIVSRSKNM